MDLGFVCDRCRLTRGLGATPIALGLVNSSPREECLAALSPAAAAASLGRPQLVDGELYVADSGAIRAPRFNPSASSDVLPVMDEQTLSGIDGSAATAAFPLDEIA
jgi:hypothetical protein